MGGCELIRLQGQINKMNVQLQHEEDILPDQIAEASSKEKQKQARSQYKKIKTVGAFLFDRKPPTPNPKRQAILE